MLRPFFDLAMIAPARQLTFRRTVAAHIFFVTLAAWLLVANQAAGGLITFGYLLVSLGMVESSALVGWRLAQLPKSQALEFLLVSPVQPKRLFFAEALVGACRFACVWLSSLPVFLALLLNGSIEATDFWPLFVMPFVWGLTVAGLVTAWVYEPVLFRRLGELLGLLGVLCYLVIGVLAAENLMSWLTSLPPDLGKFMYDSVIFIHTMNPFGVVQYWFHHDSTAWIAQERLTWVTLAGIVLLGVAWTRAAYRMKGHFHDRHYAGKFSDRAASGSEPTAFSQHFFPLSFRDKPLSWWAVRRVMEYSGRVNVYLAGGFSVVYSVYIIAGDQWPSWMGRLVFQLFEQWGGAPTIATALVVLAIVPAVFQFGLWDSTVQNRCKRLELLLLTEFDAQDYWHASLMAALKRGRTYLFISTMLWVALVVGGRIEWWQALASCVAACALWAFGFAVGFRSFSTGHQTSGLASLFTLGQPLLVYGCFKLDWPDLANLIPLGLCHLPVTVGVSWLWWLGLLALSAATWWLRGVGLKMCDADLRKWYDANQGKAAEG